MTVTARETLLHVNYRHSGKSVAAANNMGMREMQARAFEKRAAQYLLIKAPPACGKSRALMFLALDKVLHQGIEKVIVAVPQMAIGSSFRNTDLMSSGFFANWEIEDKYNLCGADSVTSKSETVLEFLNDPDAHYLVCAHPTLIYFYDKLADKTALNKTLVAVDEFHHVSASEDNRLGGVIHSLITDTTAHIVAMTGSYFRGDQVPVLDPKDEAKFEKVTYTYYEQLNGYKYLKDLSIDYAFYDGVWTDAVGEILDTHKKTIIHIPSVNSRESTKDKYNEVGAILDIIGRTESFNPETGIYSIKTADGRSLRVADLVSDNVMGQQSRTLDYLRKITKKEDVDIIIALGMAKEGFDWPWCEYALTVGYRNSLTEVVQIIGRATRDAPGKTHAQFTNLIAKPEALQEDVEHAVNSLLKAITLSLLMEQVLAPNVHFRTRSDGWQEKPPQPNGGDGVSIDIEDGENPLSGEDKEILRNNVPDIIEKLFTSSEEVKKAILLPTEDMGKVIANAELPRIIAEMYPETDLTPEEIETIAKAVYTALHININGQGGHGGMGGGNNPPEGGGKQGNPEVEVTQDNSALLNVDGKFLNLEDLDLNLILQVNPFKGAYEFVSRNIDAPTLKAIQDTVVARRSKVSQEEAMLMWPHIKDFKRQYGRDPNPLASNDYERRLGEVLAYIRRKKAEALGGQR